MSIQGIGASSGFMPVFTDASGKAQSFQEAIDSGKISAPKTYNEVALEDAGHATPVYDENGNFLHKPMTTEDWAASKSAVSADGTFVAVSGRGSAGQAGSYSLSLGSGTNREMTLDFTGDLRVGTAENGDYLVYSAERNLTTRYAADGTTTETHGDATQNASGKIHVSTSGGEIHGGDGDEVFFVFGHNATIHCGSGNDKVILSDTAENVTVNAGKGDNTITGGQLYGGAITAGDGNNTIQLQKSLDTRIALGKGNNSVKVSEYIGGSLGLGDGDNILMLGKAQGTTIKIGNGDNAVTISTMDQESALNAGDGNNTLNIGEIGKVVFEMRRIDWSTILGKSPKEAYLNLINRPIIGGSSASVTLGNGNNTVHVSSMINEASVTIGNGNNRFTVNSVLRHSSISLGDGDNDLFSTSSLQGESSISLGNGTNLIEYAGAGDYSTLRLGSGANYLKQPFNSLYARLAGGEHTGGTRAHVDTFFTRDSIRPQPSGSQANSELSQRISLLWH